jgi:very-short-patch-repair endonuclease
VLRFSNQEIRGAPDLVAARILAALDELGPVPTI